MAKAKAKRTIEITLVLNEQEALYLRGLLQNYIGDEDEPDKMYNLRADIFHAVKDAITESKKD